METIFDQETRDNIIARINKLTKENASQWGKMDICQMLRHCTLYEEMLQGKRTAVITGKANVVLRRTPDATANPAFRAQPGVIGKLITCEKDWCRMQIASRKGWVPKSNIFGAYKKEDF